MKTYQQDNTLNINILTNAGKFQFDLSQEGSNISSNQIILNSVIGTLVKHGTSGMIEPYIAERWEVSNDNKNWKFIIRKNLKAEDGTYISAKLFHESLIQNLKKFSEKSSVMMFDYLIGWNEFVNNKTSTIEGLKVNGEALEFHFTHYPDGILEFLRMPYFGLWKMDPVTNKIISTASYSIKKNSGKEVLLALRADWFTATESSFQEVKMNFLESFNPEERFDPNTILQMPLNSKIDNLIQGSYWIYRPPTILDTFVISPYKKNFFNDVNNRKMFLKRINSLPKAVIKSPYFYPTATSKKIKNESTQYNHNADAKTLTFLLERVNYDEDEMNRLHQIISHALEGSNLDYQIIHRDLKDKEMLSRLHLNDFYDVRISTVNTGAHPLYGAIKMMFCSKMGISFPGHEEEFCELIENNLKSGKEIDQIFIDNFNNSLNEKAIVIPIAHHAPKWLVSNNLDPHFLPATSPYPQFEMLKKLSRK